MHVHYTMYIVHALDLQNLDILKDCLQDRPTFGANVTIPKSFTRDKKSKEQRHLTRPKSFIVSGKKKYIYVQGKKHGMKPVIHTVRKQIRPEIEEFNFFSLKKKKGGYG